MQCNLDHIESAHHIDNHMLTQLLHELQHIRHHTLRGAVRVPLTSKSARTPAFFLIPNGSRGLVAGSTAPGYERPCGRGRGRTGMVMPELTEAVRPRSKRHGRGVATRGHRHWRGNR
uniref:PMM n=1 Tax=Arundo donax TaxID=35708 RepID=A0A0A9CJS7_ARUDO